MLDLPHRVRRAWKTTAWLGLAALGATAFACGGTGGTGGHGGSSASSSASESSSTSSASSSSSGGGAGGGSSEHLATWVRTFVGGETRASSVAVDPQGNIYVGGAFATGSADFGQGQLDCPPEAGGYRWCGLLLKLDPTGKTLWSKAFVAGHSLNLDVTKVAADDSGVVIAARWNRYQLIHSPLDMGTGPLDPPGDNPMVLARFDPSGNALFSAAFGDDLGEVVPSSLVIDGPGSFLLGGGFDTANLNLGAGPMLFLGERTMFLAQFNATSSVVWQKSFGGMAGQDLAGVGRGPKGELLLGGYFRQSLSLGGPPITSMGDWAVFQGMLDPNGTYLAESGFDAMGPTASATSAAVDGAGNTLITGMFDGALKLGVMPLVCKGDINGYLAKIDEKGAVVFAQATTEPMMSADGSFCVATDGANNVLWGAELAFSDPNGDYIQGRISKLDPAGATLWSVAGKNFGARAFGFESSGGVIAAGVFSTELDFAKSGPIKATKGSNAFIARFPP